jgi:hypothetical protein
MRLQRPESHAPTEFADGDGTDVKFRFVVAKPSDDLGVRLGSAEFAEDIGVNEVVHGITEPRAGWSLWLAAEP